MPTYDPSLPVRVDDGGADHLRRARTCLRDAKPREGVRHLRAAIKLGSGDACGELSFCMQVPRRLLTSISTYTHTVICNWSNSWVLV
jgi:hypothetical protein